MLSFHLCMTQRRFHFAGMVENLFSCEGTSGAQVPDCGVVVGGCWVVVFSSYIRLDDSASCDSYGDGRDFRFYICASHWGAQSTAMGRYGTYGCTKDLDGRRWGGTCRFTWSSAIAAVDSSHGCPVESSYICSWLVGICGFAREHLSTTSVVSQVSGRYSGRFVGCGSVPDALEGLFRQQKPAVGRFGRQDVEGFHPEVSNMALSICLDIVLLWSTCTNLIRQLTMEI